MLVPHQSWKTLQVCEAFQQNRMILHCGKGEKPVES